MGAPDNQQTAEQESLSQRKKGTAEQNEGDRLFSGVIAVRNESVEGVFWDVVVCRRRPRRRRSAFGGEARRGRCSQSGSARSSDKLMPNVDYLIITSSFKKPTNER